MLEVLSPFQQLGCTILVKISAYHSPCGDFLISNSRNIPMMHQTAYQKVYQRTDPKPRKCLIPPPRTNRDSPRILALLTSELAALEGKRYLNVLQCLTNQLGHFKVDNLFRLLEFYQKLAIFRSLCFVLSVRLSRKI